MKKLPLIIWGARGHAKVLNEFAGQAGYNIIALLDRDKEIESPIPGLAIFSGKNAFYYWKNQNSFKEVYGQVAIGGVRGYDRVEIQDRLHSEGIRFISMVHPSACVAGDSSLGPGSQILTNASVCTQASLGKGCIINTSASVDHECTLGQGVHVAPGATIAGRVKVGDYSFIGPGAVVISNITIGTNSIIGAGAVVTQDVPNDVIVYGVPARFIRNNSKPKGSK